MTVLQDMTRAVERLVAAPIPERCHLILDTHQVAALLSHAAVARQALDGIGNSGLTDTLAEIMWKADERAYGRPGKRWTAQSPQEQERFRLYARTVLLSGLI